MKAVTSLFAGLITVLTMLGCVQAEATEGFINFPASRASSDIWHSTVAISVGSLRAPLIFSGTIVYKTTVKGEVYFGILTSAHALNKAHTIGTIGDIRVSKNIHFVDQMQLIEELPGVVLADSLIVDSSLDVGFFVIKAARDKFEFAKPVSMSWSCLMKEGDYVGLIGYPGVPLRPSKDQGVQILAPKLITKRMSEGRVSLLKDIARFVGTTADSLVGNSGGPAFDENGALIGVLVGSTNASDGRYVGSELSGDGRTHSVISSCVLTKDFAQKAWVRYLMTKF